MAGLEGADDEAVTLAPMLLPLTVPVVEILAVLLNATVDAMALLLTEKYVTVWSWFVTSKILLVEVPFHFMARNATVELLAGRARNSPYSLW